MKRRTLPNKKGHFGRFGGRYAPEILIPALKELEEAYREYKRDKLFWQELNYYLREYAGRPTPLYFARNFSQQLGFKNIKVYLKREDLLHTGAHKINNALGQALLALRMGKRRVIAETGAGQHGLATATACALLGLECCIYMGAEDVERQHINYSKMKLLGAEVVAVKKGSRTLKDAINEAMRDWIANFQDSYYLLGSTVGPHPYPMIVRDFQSVIGKETKKQIIKKEGKLPDYIVACVGGGSNAMGIFYPFLNDAEVRLIGVEAAGEGLNTGKHSASLAKGKNGVLHGAFTKFLQDEDGQVKNTYSISAGLDYPGVGPEHAFLKEQGRVEYVSVDDKSALSRGFLCLSRTEGIIPALESAHAVASLFWLKRKLKDDSIVIINLSGRGDKDVGVVLDYGILPPSDFNGGI